MAAGLKLPRGLTKLYATHFPTINAGEQVGQGFTDKVMREPLIDVARRRAGETYAYEFAWQSPVRDLRAAHAMEIGFVFDAIGSAGDKSMAGPTVPKQLATRMHRDWVKFAKGEAPWERFVAPNGPVQIFDTESTLSDVPRADALEVLGSTAEKRLHAQRSSIIIRAFG